MGLFLICCYYIHISVAVLHCHGEGRPAGAGADHLDPMEGPVQAPVLHRGLEALLEERDQVLTGHEDFCKNIKMKKKNNSSTMI